MIIDAPQEDILILAAESLIELYAKEEEQSDSEKANFADTPLRAAKGWVEAYPTLLKPESLLPKLNEIVSHSKQLVTPKSKIKSALSDVLKTAFPMEASSHSTGLVIQGPIEFESLCPHHLLPVTGVAYVGYKPKTEVLGLSKLARALKILAARPVLQEQLTRDIADVLCKDEADPQDHLVQIQSEGSAVQIVARHSCMACRGVRSEAVTLTMELRGIFYYSAVKQEFYQALDSIHKSLAFCHTAK